jgi:hypothetical protein
VIIAVVVLELIACFFVPVVMASNGGEQPIFPLQVWLACAFLQLTIHYLPPTRYIRYGLVLLVALMLFAGLTSGKIDGVRYFHQALFIAAIAAIPQLWWEWSSKATADRALMLLLIALFAPPVGFASWSLANIGIVKFEAWRATQGVPYCILVTSGDYWKGGYRQAPDDYWSLSGARMISPRGGGGISGKCCQWDFHALLLTDNNELFNWSYRSQRFERVTEDSRRMLSLTDLGCP